MPSPLIQKSTIDQRAPTVAQQPPIMMLPSPPARTLAAALARDKAQVEAAKQR